MRSGKRTMIRAQVASTATGSFPSTNTPQGLGTPWMGPLPFIPIIPSTIAKLGRTVLLMSREWRGENLGVTGACVAGHRPAAGFGE